MGKLLLILGAKRYPHRQDLALPAFGVAHAKFKAFMLDGKAPIIADSNCLDLFDTKKSWSEQQQTIDDWLRTKRENIGDPRVLLVYYVGHGGVLAGEQVFLTINSTTKLDPYHSSIPRESLAVLLRNSANDFQKFLIIDCCFAAAMVRNMMSPLQDRLTVELKEVGKAVYKPDGGGLAALCASSSVASADAGGHDGLTQFTDGLLSALRIGDPRSADNLSFEKLRDLVEQQLHDRYGLDAVPPSSYFPDDVFRPIHRVPLFPNRAELPERELVQQTEGPHSSNNIQNFPLSSPPVANRDLELFESIYAEESKIAAIFQSSDFVPPRTLQGLARPIERPAAQLTNLHVIGVLLDRDGSSWVKDAAIFTAAVIIYKRQEERFFDQLVQIASDGRPVRGAAMWRVLRAIKKLSTRVDLTEPRRTMLIRALRNCAACYDSKPGHRFEGRDIVLMIAQTASLRALRIDLRTNAIFSPEQADEWEHTKARTATVEHLNPSVLIERKLPAPKRPRRVNVPQDRVQGGGEK